MKGLILKDLFNLKKQGKVYILFIAFYSLIAFSTGDSSFLGVMIFIFCTLLPVTALSYDERAQWDKYGLTMPIDRKDMVISKYILGIICAIIGLVLMLIFSTILPSDMEGNVSLLVSLFGASVILLSIVLPINFKFGVEKGRLLMMLIFFLPAAIIMALAKSNASIPVDKIIDIIPYALPIISVITLIISLGLSIRIYTVKEL